MKLNEINSKKNCALLGRQWTGVPNNPPDGTNCGEKLESQFKKSIVSESVPVCLYKKNIVENKYNNYINYLQKGIMFLILFLIIFLWH